jgi:hypothetical protein
LQSASHLTPSSEPLLSDAADVLERVTRVLAERGATNDLLKIPQSLLPLAASEVEGLEYYPWKRLLGSKAPLRIRDLQKAPGEVFVARCYRLLLVRNPSVSEAEECERHLRAGMPRAILMAKLRFSAEGRACGVPVPGLSLRAALASGLWVGRACTGIVRSRP